MLQYDFGIYEMVEGCSNVCFQPTEQKKGLRFSRIGSIMSLRLSREGAKCFVHVRRRKTLWGSGHFLLKHDTGTRYGLDVVGVYSYQVKDDATYLCGISMFLMTQQYTDRDVVCLYLVEKTDTHFVAFPVASCSNENYSSYTHRLQLSQVVQPMNTVTVVGSVSEANTRAAMYLETRLMSDWRAVFPRQSFLHEC